MIRLVFWLCCALTLALWHFGDPAPQQAVPQPSRASTPPALLVPAAFTLPIATTEPVMSSPDATLKPAPVRARSVTAEGVTKTPVTFRPTHQAPMLTVSRRDAPAGYISAQMAHVDLVEVTGTAVNLRAGPSTATRIVGSLRRGERAQILSRPGNGWIELRSDSGQQGFMSDRFAAPLR